MAQSGDVIENPVNGQRLRFIATGADTGGSVFRAEGVFRPGGFAGPRHIHPLQDERFEVQRGRAGFLVAGSEVVLGEGDTIEVPRGTPHTFWNAGDDEMAVLFEFWPAPPSTERFYEVYFGFAQEGRVNAKAMPGLLDIATVWDEVSAHAVLASPPPAVQHATFRVLRPLAQMLGRRAPATISTCLSTPNR